MSTVLAVTGLGISSTGSALFRKVLFQLRGEGLDHIVHNFEKPWFTTLESALACLVSLLLHWGHQRFAALLRWRRSRRQEQQQPLLQKQALDTQPAVSQERKTWKQLSVLAWPGALNMLSIIVQGMGLQYISASVSQMLSGSCIIFTAILSVIILKRRLNWLHLTGIGLTLVAVVIVSLTNIFYPPSTCPHSDPACMQAKHDGSNGGSITLGILLTLASQIFQAVRLIMEESLLAKMDLHPMEVLGWEGFWGTVGMAVVGMPLAWIIPGSDIGGREENTIDSIVMLWNDDALNAVNVLFFWSVVGLNVFGLLVTQVLGSVFRAVMLTARTASVWAVNLVLYSALPKGLEVGEAWMSPASWIQLFGFSLLLAGTIIYAQGSSPAAHDKGDSGGFSSEDEVDGPAPLTKRSSISNIRPLYSIYVPHSDRQAHVVPIPTANPEDLQRSSSAPTDVEAAADEGQQTQERLGGRGSLPSQLKGRLPSRGSLLNLFQRGPADAGSTTSGESGDLPMGTSPSFYRTLTHRTSWILDKDDQQLKDLLLREDAEGGTLGGQSRDRGLKPIPEDTMRLSSDVRNGSGTPFAGAEGSRRRSIGEGEPASRASPRVRWSTPSPSGRSEKSVLGQSPTPDVFMERQSSSKQPLKHLAALPEHEPGLPKTASEQSEPSDMFSMDMPTPRGK